MMSSCKYVDDADDNMTAPKTKLICNWPVISQLPVCKDTNKNVNSSEPSPPSSVFPDLLATQENVKPLVKKNGWGLHFSLTIARARRATMDLRDSVRAFLF
jgi:hypothetical protein